MSDNSSYSEDSDSGSEGEFEEVISHFEGILPYQFEPNNDAASDESSESDDEESYDQEQNRLQNSNWCTCGHCQIMDTTHECVCCQEIPKVWDTCQSVVAEGLGPAAWITEHPGFVPVCTNKYVLKTAWKQNKQQYPHSYDGPEHKQFRHIAYRQFARWCWGFLGKEVRVVLSSCAVMCIRAHFPPPGIEENFTFEGFIMQMNSGIHISHVVLSLSL